MQHYRAWFLTKGRKLPRAYRFHAADRGRAESMAQRELTKTPGADEVVVVEA